MKLYGSISNRVMENKQGVDEIKVGTGVTECLFSDRHPYEVIAVKDQKHFTIRSMRYKKADDARDYENKWDLFSDESGTVYDIVKRGKYFYYVVTMTAEDIKDFEDWDIQRKIGFCHLEFNRDVINEKGKQTKYIKMNLYIGRAEYYFDYEF